MCRGVGRGRVPARSSAMTTFDPDAVRRRWPRMGADERADVAAVVRATLRARALLRRSFPDSPALVELLAWIEDQVVEPP